MDAASFRQRASWRMSHGEHHCTLFCALDFYFYTANENVLWKEMPVPCTEPPEPSARSSRPSAWPPPRCCRPPRPNGGSSRSPPRTPSPPWSRPPCSRFSPRRPPVRPLCRPRGSGSWRWRPGPPLAASWCFPPAGGAGQYCGVALKIEPDKQLMKNGAKQLMVAAHRDLVLYCNILRFEDIIRSWANISIPHH